MNKEKDYLDKIEVHRQEVELDEVSRRRTRTRSSRRQNNVPKITGMKILVAIFIFIPLSLLGYVWLVYEPEAEPAAPEIDNSIVHIEKNNTPAASPSVEEEEDESKESEGQDSSNNSSNDSSNDSSNASTEDVEVNEEEEEAIDKAAADAEQALKEQQQKEAEQSSNTTNAKTHVVQEKDTLYSIAMKYYKDPTKVEAIKKANNLSSDSIPLGKALILP